MHWNHCGVWEVVTHPKYIGWHVYGRTSQRLSTQAIRKPILEWVVTPGSYERIVDALTFRQAQLALQRRTINKSNDQLLEELRSILL
jgi:Recombinase